MSSCGCRPVSFLGRGLTWDSAGRKKKKKISPSRAAVNIAPCCSYVWSAVCCLQPLVHSCFLPSQLLCMWVCKVCTTLQPSNQPATCKHALYTGSTRGCGQTCGKTAYDSTLTCRHVPYSWSVVCCTLDDVVKRTTPLLGELRFAVGGPFGAAVSVWPVSAPGWFLLAVCVSRFGSSPAFLRLVACCLRGGLELLLFHSPTYCLAVLLRERSILSCFFHCRLVRFLVLSASRVLKRPSLTRMGERRKKQQHQCRWGRSHFLGGVGTCMWELVLFSHSWCCEFSTPLAKAGAEFQTINDGCYLPRTNLFDCPHYECGSCFTDFFLWFPCANLFHLSLAV